ncbi:SHIRT domain-containing protein [uncultured Parolsenella sp.]|uniref:SHIRT domain-containing protein n=1 Tax=uncultured Parolsenella sp. TaxID=2083008 RepID=UPI0025E8330E|nr:SHIRT domain-containing protein [uncultured Parolsenella sp.]
MSKIRRELALVAALALYVLVMPVSALAATPTTIEVGNSSEFDSAVATVNAATSGEYVIGLTDDILTGGASFSSSQPVSVVGNRHTITLKQYGCLSINKGTELDLGSKNGGDSLTISGGNVNSNDVPGLLYVEGACNMYSGVTLADREGNNYFGGGVTVQGGTFHMYGGTIENCGISGGSVCYGGGVAVIYGGSFVMDAGEIKNCYAESSAKDYWDPNRCITAMGGGVFVSGGSSFVMNGGIIANNNATNMGGGIAIVASDVEVGNGFGTLKSSVDLCGGTIKENVAHDGAGVFASAYYYAWAPVLCANTPSIGAQEKQGLRVENAKILGNKADQQDGRGGGVFTAMLKAPVAVQINNSTIEDNSAAIGGGVMSYGYYTAMSINGSTIAKNTATTYGGGFAADTNTEESAGTTVSNTKLCNNIADKAASDIYLNGSAAKLSPASDMNELYLGKPDDATNQKIDGWYLDDETSRYAAQSKGERNEYINYGSIESAGKVCLIAANNPTLAKVTFTNEDGSLIYSEKYYAVGTKANQIDVPTPTKPSDDTYDYYFDSWHTTIGDVTGDVVYKAQFKRVFKRFGAKYTFSSTSSGKQLPSEVLALLPNDTRDYVRNDVVSAFVPSRTTVDVADGTWFFVGYDRDSAIADMATADSEGNVTFAGSWKFVEKGGTSPEAGNGNQGGANGDDNHQTGPNGKPDTAQKADSSLPETGDDTGVGLGYALLLAAMVALGSAVYVRRGRNC